MKTAFERAYARTIKNMTVAWRLAYPDKSVPSMQDIYRKIQSGKVKAKKG